MNIARLVNPQSIAILGATERPSPGLRLMQTLERFGYPGAVYPVNPKYAQVLGKTCYPSLKDIPDVPDVVVFCVGPAQMLDHFRDIARLGVGAAVIYAGGFAEQGESGKALQAEIASICNEAGVALCGPNCMGVLNPTTRATTFMAEGRDFAGLAGSVGFITQSGAIANGMLGDIRRFGFSLMASTGNEAVVATVDLMEYLIDDPATKVIGTFTETVRQPERYVAALDRAAAAGKPVVVLKVGRSERAQRSITSHTGGLSGESRVFSALLKAHRAIEVNDMDEMAEVLAVCQGPLPTGRRIAAITGSGGQAELILDVGTSAGIELPPLSDDERKEIERVVGPITGDGNPLDAWGAGTWDVNLPHALSVLDRSDGNDVIVYYADYNQDQPMVSHDRLMDDAKLFADGAASSAKPHYLMNTRPGLMYLPQVKFLAERGIRQLGGTRQGLGAIDRVARWNTALPGVKPRLSGNVPAASRIAAKGRKVINEFDAKTILKSYGVRVTREALASSLEQALSAAEEIGYPVVLKAVADDIPHKSEYGLVAVKLGTKDELVAAWGLLSQRVERLEGPVELNGFLVQEYIAGGIEMLAGISRDPSFGLSIVLGMGGVDVEVLRDVSLRMLPLREGDAEAMISELRGAALLGAHRGRPPADVASLADCLHRLAEFAWDERRHIAEVDLNPIKVLPEGQGAVIVDALIVTSDPSQGAVSPGAKVAA